MGHAISCRLRVEGELGPDWASWFGGLAVHAEPDGTSLLVGEVADQAALHGLLAAIRDVGLPLISVETVAPGAPAPPAGDE